MKGKVQVSIPDMYSKDEQTKKEIANELLSERNQEGQKEKTDLTKQEIEALPIREQRRHKTKRML